MTIHPLAYRYAQSVLELAEEAGKTKEVEHDLKQLDTLNNDKNFHEVIHNPTLSAAIQQKCLQAILKDLKVHDLTQKWIGVLIRNRRLGLLPEAIKAFQHLVQEKKGEVVAVVTTAQELNKAQQKDLKTALEKQLGKNISLELKINPELWGGMVIQIGSTMIDLSLKSKLQRIHLAIKGVA